MFISHKHDFVFIHVPKTAGSSIHVALKDFYGLKGILREDPPPPIHHMGAKDLLINHPECAPYFKFAFVRNPYERLLSGYSEFTQMASNNGGRANYSLDIFKYKDFSHFCAALERSEWIRDVHFSPQHEFLYDGDECLVDFVGKYENLQNDLSHICKTVGIHNIDMSMLPRHRQTKHVHWAAYYLPKTKRAIKECYARDFELFGYED